MRCFQKALSTLFKNGTFSKRKKKKISTSSLVHKGCLVFVTTVGIYTNRRRCMTVVCHFDRNQFRLFTEKISAFFCRKGTFAPILIRIANSCTAVSWIKTQGVIISHTELMLRRQKYCNGCVWFTNDVHCAWWHMQNA